MNKTCAKPTRRGIDLRWKILAVGFFANASFYTVFAGLPVTAVSMRIGYHLTDADVGLVFGLFGGGLAISELPWGMLSDRWGERTSLLLGLTALFVTLCVMSACVAPSSGFVPPTLHLWLAALSLGIFGGSVNGASGRAIMSSFDESERGFAMSIRQAALPVGGGIGALLLPPIAASMGFSTVYMLLALLTGIAALLAWAYVRPTQREHDSPPASTPVAAQQETSLRAHTRKQASSIWANVRVWRISLAIGVLCAAQCSILTFAALFLHDIGQFSMIVTSLAVVGIQACSTALRIYIGRATDRRKNRGQFLRNACLLCFSAFLSLALFVACDAGSHGTHFLRVAMLVAFVFTGICVSAWHGVAYVELATAAGAQRVATALGLGNTCAFVGMFVCTVAVPALIVTSGWPVVWLAASACAIVAVLSFPDTFHRNHAAAPSSPCAPVTSNTSMPHDTSFPSEVSRQDSIDLVSEMKTVRE
ncbi:MFS transporter [Paraburkholderia unamae]|uniref:Sugar phosphate permease n=1 Tax=Paraburkholderia unamae TaxID=219649 RepID=A0ABX5K8N0_9BURK|nr:MFS transporter [Paraburkholderia unamae]PVX70893.1 sugar phosphate permease [Paraburkholderia unamae]